MIVVAKGKECYISRSIYDEWTKESLDHIREYNDNHIEILDDFVRKGIETGRYMIVERHVGRRTHIIHSN